MEDERGWCVPLLMELDSELASSLRLVSRQLAIPRPIGLVFVRLLIPPRAIFLLFLIRSVDGHVNGGDMGSKGSLCLPLMIVLPPQLHM